MPSFSQDLSFRASTLPATEMLPESKKLQVLTCPQSYRPVQLCSALSPRRIAKDAALDKAGREGFQVKPLSGVSRAFFQERLHIRFLPPARRLLRSFLAFCMAVGKTTGGQLASLGSATDLQLPPAPVLHLQTWENCILRADINPAYVKSKMLGARIFGVVLQHLPQDEPVTKFCSTTN